MLQDTITRFLSKFTKPLHVLLFGLLHCLFFVSSHDLLFTKSVSEPRRLVLIELGNKIALFVHCVFP